MGALTCWRKRCRMPPTIRRPSPLRQAHAARGEPARPARSGAALICPDCRAPTRCRGLTGSGCSVIAEACDRARLVAERRDITVVRRTPADVGVRGNENQLVTAVRNLSITPSRTARRHQGRAWVSDRDDEPARDLGERPGHWHCRGRSGPSLRTLLPSRPGSVTIHRRHRSRLGNRQARGHQPRW